MPDGSLATRNGFKRPFTATFCGDGASCQNRWAGDAWWNPAGWAHYGGHATEFEQRKAAIGLFNQGRDELWIWHPSWINWRRMWSSGELDPVFLEIQISTALVDGELHPGEQGACWWSCRPILAIQGGILTDYWPWCWPRNAFSRISSSANQAGIKEPLKAGKATREHSKKPARC